MTECRNCDKPISGGRYCSNVCEDMDKHPAPRDDMERLTRGNAWEVYVATPFGPNPVAHTATEGEAHRIAAREREFTTAIVGVRPTPKRGPS